MTATLRLAVAIAALILLGGPPPATAEPTYCLEKPLPINARIETSLGTIELCLIDHDIDINDGSAAWQISRISNAFLDATKQGKFNDSFFHVADKCPEWEEPYCAAPAVKLHGGKFRVSTAHGIDEHAIASNGWALYQSAPGQSVLQNTRGTISVVDDRSGSTATADWFINVDSFNWRPGRLEMPRMGHPFGVVVTGMALVDNFADLTTVNTARPPSRLYVRQAESACLSGDDTGDSEACVCNDANRTDGSCVAAQDYLWTLVELWVRDDGSHAPCIHGDDDDDLIACPCSDTDKGNGTCVPFDNYIDGKALEVRLAHPVCLSGDVDAAAEDACTCRAIDVNEDRCGPADDYALEHPELQVVSKDGVTEACLTGDVAEDAIEEETCTCVIDDTCPTEGTCDTCTLLYEYVNDEYDKDNDNDYYQRIRPREEACLGTGTSDPDCACSDTEQTDGTCQAAADYFQDTDHQIKDSETGRKCIFGDDDPLNEACVCDDDCVDADEYLARDPDSQLWVRVPVPACVSSITTDDQGDASCPCDVAGELAPCQSSLDYVRGHLNLEENDPDWQVPLDYYGADPIVNIDSTTLVMIDAIPEPGSLGLEASALVALGLLAGRRRRRHRTR